MLVIWCLIQSIYITWISKLNVIQCSAILWNTMKGKYVLDTHVISWFHIWFTSIVFIIFFKENQKPEAFWVFFFFLISETLVKSSEVSYNVAYFSKDIYWKEKLGCPWSLYMEWHQWRAEKYNSISPISSTKYSLT